MRQRSSTATTDVHGRRPWSCASPRSRWLFKRSYKYTTMRSQPTDAARPAPTSVTATAAVASMATATAGAAIREPRGARTPSQMAEELHQYAAAAAASGRMPGNDAFLAACLSDLSAPHRLRRLRPRQLAVLLRSLVGLGAHPGEDWLADLDACCYCHPGPFDPASATAVLQGLAALHTAAAAPASATSSPAQPSTAAPATHHQPQQLQQHHRHRSRGKHLHQYGTAPASSLQHKPPQQPHQHQQQLYRFPQAVYLRLLQGGVHNYSYEQLATLLQSFRSLGVAVSDEVALQVGSRMAAQLLEMAPERRQRALAAVLGTAPGV